MVFPSDALLQRIDCLQQVDNQGSRSYIRDYKKSLLVDPDLKFIIGSIEGSFAKSGYPIENLEQQLKQIDNQNAVDEVDAVSKDSKSILLNTARPDFVLEIDYDSAQDPTTRDPRLLVRYILTGIDTYTNKTIASITQQDISNKDNQSINVLINNNLTKKLDDFQKQLGQRFKDINENGAEITLRVTVDGNTTLQLGDECLGNENYNDHINDWLKTNTVNQSYTPVINTDKELKYTNIRIKARTDDGKKYTAYDFANDLRANLSKSCGISATNKTQGIGDAYITVKGLK